VIIPVNVTPNLIYILIAGFLAISAMFLPGISGAFILLILGVYEFMLNVIHNITDNIAFFIVFLIGAALGAFIISRVISFLFKKDRCKTLYVLLGLVIGSLSIPIKRMFQESNVWSIPSITITIVFFLLGFFIVMAVSKIENKK
jgi:putative membrane protein